MASKNTKKKKQPAGPTRDLAFMQAIVDLIKKYYPEDYDPDDMAAVFKWCLNRYCPAPLTAAEIFGDVAEKLIPIAFGSTRPGAPAPFPPGQPVHFPGFVAPPQPGKRKK